MISQIFKTSLDESIELMVNPRRWWYWSQSQSNSICKCSDSWA